MRRLEGGAEEETDADGTGSDGSGRLRFSLGFGAPFRCSGLESAMRLDPSEVEVVASSKDIRGKKTELKLLIYLVLVRSISLARGPRRPNLSPRFR